MILAKARGVFEEALQVLGDEFADETLYIAFAKFEVRCREVICSFIHFISFFFLSITKMRKKKTFFLSV